MTYLQTSPDIPLIIQSANTSSERRITPSWTISQLKSKLEPVTGIPPSCQKLTLRLPGQDHVAIEAQDEDYVQVGSWSLQAYAEVGVTDTRPPNARLNLNDPSDVPKYTMPTSTYESLPSSVLAWKKNNQLGRFDPSAPEKERKKILEGWEEVEKKNLTLNARTRLLPTTSRLGTIAFIGPVLSLPGPLGSPWVGVILDEPQGKNDGCAPDGTRYFSCESNRGVFVRPDRCEVGEWEVRGLDDELDEMGEEDEEI
ncbi:hypothetical protein MMC14_002124 [Varicellaria rhodocarpa]|nr:hypothetical protein [Varicellaria rhodocarpa]